MLSVSLVTHNFNRGKCLIYTSKSNLWEDIFLYDYNVSLKDKGQQINDIYGFSYTEFAEFFIPKTTSLYEEVFDIEIENLRFFALPVRMDEDDLGMKSTVKMTKKLQKNKEKQIKKTKRKLTAFSLVFSKFL